MPSINDLLASMDYGPSPESTAAANAWLEDHGRRFGHWIGGRWVAGKGHFPTVNPATGKPLAEVAQATPAQLESAVKAAEAALPAWQALGDGGRARVLYAIARMLQKHARLFAVLETLDNGKPIRETRDADLPLAIRHFYHHAGWAQLLSETHPGHEPLGVVGQIVPWNFPLLMLAWKIAPALACGNVVVFKPAEQTSLTALLFAELCAEAGVPPGVINVVTGDGAVGQALVAHPRLAKIAFTGSTEVGRSIRQATAGTGRRLSLELGGKSPYIVFADADLDGAVEGLVDSIFFNQGQVCCAGSRLLVHEGTAPRLLDKLRARMSRIRLGDPLDKSTDMGALVDATQWRRVQGFVERAAAQGATVHQACATALPAGGGVAHCFYPPTLVTGVDTASEIVREEVFGPVLAVQTFRTPAEAVELANHTRYGLAASVWSESIGLALDVAPRLKAGVVWVNTANQFDAACGFGGYRESGFGREGGREGLREYLRERSPHVGGGEDAGTAASSRPARRGAAARAATAALVPDGGGIDRTVKLYIGGKQVRPDGGYSREIRAPAAGRSVPRLLGLVSEGNRKDIRNAVEAARAAAAWSRQTAHARAQVLFYLAENLSAQRLRFEATLALTTDAASAAAEVERALTLLFRAAAWADKFDGAVHQPPVHGVTLALNEPVGIVGLVAPQQAPLAGLLERLAPAITLGNRVVAVPSSSQPLVTGELIPWLETSDVPAGVVNLVTGDADALADVLAGHAEVDAFWWPDADATQAARTQRLSAGNLKRTWVSAPTASLQDTLQEATQVKNVWVPYGV